MSAFGVISLLQVYLSSGLRRTRKGDEDVESTPDDGFLVGASGRDLGVYHAPLLHIYLESSSFFSFDVLAGNMHLRWRWRLQPKWSYVRCLHGGSVSMFAVVQQLHCWYRRV